MAVDSITFKTDEKSVTVTNEQFRRVVAGNVARAGVSAPSEDEFEGGDFLESAAMQALAEDLMGRFPGRFGHLTPLSLAYLWKRKGGQRSGGAVYGKCQKPSGLAKHFSNVDFVVWLAADHCRDAEFSAEQYEALLFHELCHASTDEETGEPKTVPHDFEGFRAELETYGFWSDEFLDMAGTIRQLPLFAA